MNRIILIASAAPVPLLADASLKSVALLLLAALCALLLRRASAAARHVVWLAAVLALLLVPVLSVVLPGWRVLPHWAAVEAPNGKHEKLGGYFPGGAAPASTSPASMHSLPVAQPSPVSPSPLPALPATDAAVPAPEVAVAAPAASPAPAPPVSATNWLLPVWVAGGMFFLLRLVVAHWLLYRGAQRSHPAVGPLLESFSAALKESGLRQPVRLLVDAGRTIPVAWGIIRPRLLMPEEAQQWDEAQLRSVFMHELAHLRRRDPLVQFLTQLVCAFHWFNPLVWFAAWRLHVERERACDDLVLASGVRPSEYAGHLLHVATQLSPARWTAACGLAMARKSSLEGRLLAVLSEKLNRRGLTRALTVAAIALSAAVAIPVAMLRAQGEKRTDPPAADGTAMNPKNENARRLFKTWQALARTGGNIPGALIGTLAKEVDLFLTSDQGKANALELAATRKRMDGSRDWTPDEVVALLDEVAAIADRPVAWAIMPLTFENDLRNLQTGGPLPQGLAGAAWGPPDGSGLRTAWLLEPRAEAYALGSALKARVLFHNTGKQTVIFKTPLWHELGPQAAHDAKGAPIPVSEGPTARLSGMTPMVAYRLAPGEYCEVTGGGVGVGAVNYDTALSVLDVKDGDEVTLADTVDLHYGWMRTNGPKTPAEYWQSLIASRVALEGPGPSSTADRERLLHHVTQNLFGEEPTAGEVTAFTADHGPDALANVTARLQARPQVSPVAGILQAGSIKFRVIAADPSAAQKPLTVDGPNTYALSDSVNLLVTGNRTIATGILYHYSLHTDGLRLSMNQAAAGTPETNKAYLVFSSPAVATPLPAYEIALPEGRLTYAMAWERGAGSLWITQKGFVRSYNFTNPAQVQETRYEPGSVMNIPEPLRAALKGALEGNATVGVASGISATNGDTRIKPGTEENLKWGEPVNGLRTAVAFLPLTDKSKPDELPEFYLALQNVSNAPLHLSDAGVDSKTDLRMLDLRIDGRIVMGLGARVPALGDVTLPPRGVHTLIMFAPGTRTDGHTIGQLMAEGAIKDSHQGLQVEFTIDKAPAGAWTGKLRTAMVSSYEALGRPQPKAKEGRALLALWLHHTRENGNFPGGLIGRLSDKVHEFIRNNTGDAGGDSYAKKMAPLVPRLDASRDWTPAEVVALMDDIAAATPIPLETTMEKTTQNTWKEGAPLPPELADAPWGPAQPSGLRMAYLLEPRATEHHLGTPLKGRLLFHNSGKDTVVFHTAGWHQLEHGATDAKGAEIKVESMEWMTIGRLTAFRLAPGEFVEVNTPGLGVGAHRNRDDWQDSRFRLGSWVEAKAGDDVTLTSTPLTIGWAPGEPVENRSSDAARWWLRFITWHLSQDLPLPADPAERKHLVYRAGMEIFGTPLSTKEMDSFVNDADPNALDHLAKLLVQRTDTRPATGELRSGPTKFRVLPVDPNAAKKPRTASNPGQYPLGGNTTLVVTRRPDGERILNEAYLSYAPPEETIPAPHYELKLSDGYNTWAASWIRGGTELWVSQKDLLRKYDFAKFSEVKETRYEGTDVATAPVQADIREALRTELEVPEAPQKPKRPAGPPASSIR